MRPIVRLAILLLLHVSALAESGPNLLFVIVDDLRPTLSAWGDSRARTPHIDALAASSVVFRNAYANVPVCGASRASLMSGLRPTASRFVDFSARLDRDAPDAVPLHSYLKAQGWHTESLGKVLHHPRDSAEGWSRPPWHPKLAVPPEQHTGHSNYQLAANIEAFRAGGHGPAWERAALPDDAYFDGQIATRAVARLQELAAGQAPFFLAVGFVKPHLPFTAPERYWSLYDGEDFAAPVPPGMPAGIPREARHSWGELRNFANIPAVPRRLDEATARSLRHGYYASVSYADAQVGKLLAALDRLELADDTIVMLFGDHGFSLGEHGLWVKHSPFDIATRVPLIVRVPGKPATGASDGLVELVDLYPTVTELLGLPGPAELHGDSFVAQLDDPAAPGKPAVYPRWKNAEVVKTPGFAMTQWFGQTGDVRAGMLFDHRRDRAETVNLYETELQAGTRQRLAALIKKLRGSQ